jgi:predicted nucleic acid-binding protein
MKVFIDSNIIIETFKENYNKTAKDMLSFILKSISHNEIEAFINEVVESEVIYKLVFKAKPKMDLEKLKIILFSFTSLEIGENTREIFFDIIKKYNLKPNDALILATCKHHNIKYLISLDSDFEKACEEERIVLINSVKKLKKILNS